MAEEETAATAAAEAEAVASPPPSDHKRKLEDLDSEEAPKHETSSPPPSETSPMETTADGNEAPNGYQKEEEISKDSPDAKRSRLEEEANGSAADAGQQVEEVEVPQAENSEHPAQENVLEPATEISGLGDTAADVPQQGNLPPSEQLAIPQQENFPPSEQLAVPQQENFPPSEQLENPQQENFPPSEQPVLPQQGNLAPQADLPQQDLQTTRKIEVPNNKVGVLIGKAGDTIRFLQFNSGARIQITRDAEADPYSSTRPVELIGTVESINKAEKLIRDVIAEADAGGSPSLVARGFGTAQTGSEQMQMQVPYEKVGLIIGKGGETIKNLQTKTGARIQVILQNLPEGDMSKERTIRVTGTKDQIENARELIKDVLSQNPVRPSPLSGGYSQQTYRPRGPSGPHQWGPRGPPPVQPTSYDSQRGMYPTQTTQYPPQGYSGYSHQQAPRGSFNPGWDQRHPAPIQAPPQSGSYGYYGQGGYAADGPSAATSVPAGAATPAPAGHAPNQMNYYGQPQGAMQPPYSQPVPQQGYGHGYDNPKYDNQAPPQQPYGVHGGPQPGPYPPLQVNPDSGYMQQSYGGRPGYGMPSQGPSPQSYGPPRAGQPADVPYQGPISSSHMQGPTGSSQQPYPYATGGPPQQPYPYASAAAATDGYAQPNPVPASAPFAQPGGQPVPIYSQGGQPTPVYPQAGAQATPGYGQQGAQPMPGYAQPGAQYPPSQPGYGEQPAPNTVNYGYQGSGDTVYNSMQAPAYGAPPSGQTGYMQPASNQPSYEQPMPQSGYSGTAGTTAPVGYAKNVSPQPGYTQYESGQAYGHH